MKPKRFKPIVVDGRKPARPIVMSIFARRLTWRERVRALLFGVVYLEVDEAFEDEL